MKKLLFVALAAVGFTACVQNEELAVPQNTAAITFADAYVSNATKADPTTTTASIVDFDVWAFMDEATGVVLADEDVTKNGGVWSYYNTQYWFPNHTYYFAALSPMESANVAETLATGDDAKLGLGTVEFTNANGTEDLLYAKAKVTTPDAATLANQGMEPVNMHFQHLLSKVKFTFQNGFATDKVTVEVKNVKMVAPAKADINLAQATYNWDNHAETVDLVFGETGVVESTKKAAATDERLTIPAPATQSYNVSFDVVVYQNGQKAMEVSKEATIEGLALEMGKAYNFTAVIDPTALDLHAIEFTASVEAWDTEVEHNVGYYVAANGDYVVTSEQGLQVIVEDINEGVLPANTDIVLNSDIDLSLTRGASNWTPLGTSAKPFKGTFDGNGKTIKNLVIDGGSSSDIGFFGVTHDGEIKNVVFENAIVSGRLNVGVVAGQPYTSKYSNITVKGHVEVNGMAYVGAVGGKNAYANWNNITVNVDETSYVNALSEENGKAYRTYVGGVIGFCGEGGHTFSNIYSNIDVKGSTIDVGGIVGIAHYGNNFVNCVCEGDVEIYNASEEADAQQIGGIAGVWHNENGTKVTFTNCSFTGELKANNGYVINTNKFGKLVCDAYGNGTGVLVIDGTEFTLANGNVLINGCTPVSTADELVAALEANEGVYLLNNIKIDPATMSNAYGKTGINVKNGQTIDGGGHTLDIKGAGGTWDSGINTTGGLIKNITVTGSFRGIFINHTSTHSEKVVLENVTLKDVVYTISCDQGLYQGIEATNCTFNGWTSFAKTAGEAKFENCYFGEGSGYKYCRPYSNTEFVNCTFCSGYAVDTTRATVTFTDCTWEE